MGFLGGIYIGGISGASNICKKIGVPVDEMKRDHIITTLLVWKSFYEDFFFMLIPSNRFYWKKTDNNVRKGVLCFADLSAL